SGDEKKANTDVFDYSSWPHDRQTLIDDLWALAVARLPELSAYEKRISQKAILSGRDLEPWRAILAIALWLDESGVAELSARMNKLALDYQKERREFESHDLTRLVVSAISAIFAISAISSDTPLSTTEITNKAAEIAKDEEMDIDLETINTKRVGWVLTRLRLEKEGREEGKKGAQRLIRMADVERGGTGYSPCEPQP